MNQRSIQYKVGLFVTLIAVLAGGLLVFILQERLFRGRKLPYYIDFTESVKGLLAGSPVNFQGINVGSVVDVRFARGVTRVTIAVDLARCVIQTETVAKLDRAFVTGQTTVELEGYREDGERLEPYSYIRAVPSVGVVVTKTLTDVVQAMEGTLADIRLTSEGLQLFLTPRNADAATALLEELAAAARVARGEMEGLSEEIVATLSEARSALQDVSSASAGLQDLMGRPIEGSIADLVGDLRRTATTMESGSRELDALLEESRSRVLRGLWEFGEALAEVRALARDLRSSPSALVFGGTRAERPIPDTAPRAGGR